MAINVAQLVKDMLAAAGGAAKGHGADLKNYLEARAQLIAEGYVQIYEDRNTGKITDADAKFAKEQIVKSEETSLLAIEVTLKAAAQDAINAALAVATAAVNKAIGFALL
jgi:hypothetical protein